MSKTCILCHIVFGTKRRMKTIPTLTKPTLYPYISGIIKGKKSTLISINGMPDHIHILLDLNPTVALADIVKSIKQSSTNWIKQNKKNFPLFEGWGKGYYAASVSQKLKESCKKYIEEQELHHGGEEFMRELQILIEKTGLEWYPDEWE